MLVKKVKSKFYAGIQHLCRVDFDYDEKYVNVFLPLLVSFGRENKKKNREEFEYFSLTNQQKIKRRRRLCRFEFTIVIKGELNSYLLPNALSSFPSLFALEALNKNSMELTAT